MIRKNSKSLMQKALILRSVKAERKKTKLRNMIKANFAKATLSVLPKRMIPISKM